MTPRSIIPISTLITSPSPPSSNNTAITTTVNNNNNMTSTNLDTFPLEDRSRLSPPANTQVPATTVRSNTEPISVHPPRPTDHHCYVYESYLKAVNQSATLHISLIVRPSHCFDHENYVYTPLGYIYKIIFSNNVPSELLNCIYIDRFPRRLVTKAAELIEEPENVTQFILDVLKQIPCNVPIRWGVIYNFKFRGSFPNLTAEKWKLLGKLLQQHKFADIERQTYYLRDGIDSLDTQANEEDEVPADVSVSGAVRIVPPSYDSTVSAFSVNFQKPNDTIFSSAYESAQLVAEMKPPFAISSILRRDVLFAVRFSAIFEGNLGVEVKVIKVLSGLPTEVPLRWGIIYAKYLRLKGPNALPTVEQWKAVKDLLSENGYTINYPKIYKQCVRLRNHPEEVTGQ